MKMPFRKNSHAQSPAAMPSNFSALPSIDPDTFVSMANFLATAWNSKFVVPRQLRRASKLRDPNDDRLLLIAMSYCSAHRLPNDLAVNFYHRYQALSALHQSGALEGWLVPSDVEGCTPMLHPSVFDIVASQPLLNSGLFELDTFLSSLASKAKFIDVQLPEPLQPSLQIPNQERLAA